MDEATLKFAKLEADGHPPLQQETLEDFFIDAAVRHFEEGDADEHSGIDVSVCLLLAMIREILAYRDRYGLIELPHDYEARLE